MADQTIDLTHPDVQEAIQAAVAAAIAEKEVKAPQAPEKPPLVFDSTLRVQPAREG